MNTQIPISEITKAPNSPPGVPRPEEPLQQDGGYNGDPENQQQLKQVILDGRRIPDLEGEEPGT